MNISEITEQEFADNFDFIMDMIERNKTTFKIIRKDGSAVMAVPVTQRAAPVDPEVMEQVEEYKEEMMKYIAKSIKEQNETQNS